MQQHSKLKPSRKLINIFKAQITSVTQVWVPRTALDKEHIFMAAVITVFSAFYYSTRAFFGGCGNLVEKSCLYHTHIRKTLCNLVLEREGDSRLSVSSI